MGVSDEAPESREHIFNSRQFSRDSVKIVADIRESPGGRFKVSVIDLSRSGFRMHSASFVEKGKTIFLTMPGFEPLEARIAWYDKEYYGCEFSQRLHVAIYDHLKATFPTLEPQ